MILPPNTKRLDQEIEAALMTNRNDPDLVETDNTQPSQIVERIKTVAASDSSFDAAFEVSFYKYSTGEY